MELNHRPTGFNTRCSFSELSPHEQDCTTSWDVLHFCHPGGTRTHDFQLVELAL